jgi:hypothetical protein
LRVLAASSCRRLALLAICRLGFAACAAILDRRLLFEYDTRLLVFMLAPIFSRFPEFVGIMPPILFSIVPFLAGYEPLASLPKPSAGLAQT